MVNIVRKSLVWVLAGLFVLAILAFMFTYTVRFTERAVVTTFGRADETDVVREPGLKLRWPYPVQSVTKYDTRQRFHEMRAEQQQTADNQQVVVEAFVTWQVSDPLAFFRSFSDAGSRAEDHYRKAEQTIDSHLRSAVGEVSKYTMEQLFNARQGGSSLGELEDRMLAAVREAELESEEIGSLRQAGIEVTGIGIHRVVLPEQTTTAVINRMAANRNRLAESYVSEGRSQAQKIRASADADAERIRQFAQARAAEIRAMGEREAAQYLAMQNENPELAVFLQNIRLMREGLARRLTLVLSEEDFGMKLFSPGALRDGRPGQIPSPFPEARVLDEDAGADEGARVGAATGGAR